MTFEKPVVAKVCLRCGEKDYVRRYIPNWGDRESIVVVNMMVKMMVKEHMINEVTREVVNTKGFNRTSGRVSIKSNPGVNGNNHSY